VSWHSICDLFSFAPQLKRHPLGSAVKIIGDSAMRRTLRRNLDILPLVAAVTTFIAGCNPYQCGTDARSATSGGRLGQLVARPSPSANDSGGISLMLNEWRGSVTQQGVIAFVRVRGFVSGVSKLHIHEGTPANPGRTLWESANGYLAGDSVWQTGINPFEGPGPWSDLWNLLESGGAYFEIHSPVGDSISAGLLQVSSSPFSPSCT